MDETDAMLCLVLDEYDLLFEGPQTAELAWDWTGGHPLLLRQFGSAALTLARQRGGAGGQLLSTDPFCDLIPEGFRRRRFVRDTTAEILDLLSLRYPAALTLLIELAVSADLAGHSVAEVSADAEGARVLLDFGLLQLEAGRPVIPRYLSWHIPRSTHAVRHCVGA